MDFMTVSRTRNYVKVSVRVFVFMFLCVGEGEGRELERMHRRAGRGLDFGGGRARCYFPRY